MKPFYHMRTPEDVEKRGMPSLERTLDAAEYIIYELLQSIQPPAEQREDICQSCRLAIIESYRQYHQGAPTQLPIWITNTCIKTIRAMYQQEISTLDAMSADDNNLDTIKILLRQGKIEYISSEEVRKIVDTESDPQSQALTEEVRRAIRSLLLSATSTLTKIQQQIVGLILDAEMPPLAIASLLKMSPRSVYEHLETIRVRYPWLSPNYHQMQEHQGQQAKNIASLNQQYGILLQPKDDRIFLIGLERLKAARLAIELAQMQYGDTSVFTIGYTKTGGVSIEPMIKQRPDSTGAGGKTMG